MQNWTIAFMEFISLATQAATVIALISLIAAILSLKRDIRSQNLQSFFYLHRYLSQEEFSIARKKVRTDLSHKPYEQWNEEDKLCANRVCASYDQTGILIAIGALDENTCEQFLSSSWGNSIIDQYEALKPFLDDNQTPHQTGREFFKHFTKLYELMLLYPPEVNKTERKND